MIIKSYLVYPIDGQLTTLQNKLSTITGCELIQAENQELLVLVTEADDKTADDQLFSQLQELPSIAAITLVSGHNEPESISIEVGVK